MVRQVILEKKALLEEELSQQILTNAQVEEINEKVEAFKHELMNKATCNIEANKAKIAAKLEVVNELLDEVEEPATEPQTSLVIDIPTL